MAKFKEENKLRIKQIGVGSLLALSLAAPIATIVYQDYKDKAYASSGDETAKTTDFNQFDNYKTIEQQVERQHSSLSAVDPSQREDVTGFPERFSYFVNQNFANIFEGWDRQGALTAETWFKLVHFLSKNPDSISDFTAMSSTVNLPSGWSGAHDASGADIPYDTLLQSFSDNILSQFTPIMEGIRDNHNNHDSISPVPGIVYPTSLIEALKTEDFVNSFYEEMNGITQVTTDDLKTKRLHFQIPDAGIVFDNNIDLTGSANEHVDIPTFIPDPDSYTQKFMTMDLSTVTEDGKDFVFDYQFGTDIFKVFINNADDYLSTHTLQDAIDSNHIFIRNMNGVRDESNYLTAGTELLENLVIQRTPVDSSAPDGAKQLSFYSRLNDDTETAYFNIADESSSDWEAGIETGYLDHPLSSGRVSTYLQLIQMEEFLLILMLSHQLRTLMMKSTEFLTQLEVM